jgi:hypothetical protein
VYWSNYSGTVGRATLDGAHVSQKFIRRAGGFGMAVDPEGPAPRAAAAVSARSGERPQLRRRR